MGTKREIKLESTRTDRPVHEAKPTGGYFRATKKKRSFRRDPQPRLQRGGPDLKMCFICPARWFANIRANTQKLRVSI